MINDDEKMECKGSKDAPKMYDPIVHHVRHKNNCQKT